MVGVRVPEMDVPCHVPLFLDSCMDWLDECRSAAEEDDWDKVRDIAQIAFEHQPNHALVLAVLGEALMMLGEYKQAEASLKQALSLSPANLDALVILATLYDKQGRRADIEQVCHSLSAINPEVARQVQVAYLSAPVPLSGQFGKIPVKRS
ncbi:MAG: tetratricopeptide repeat protein [Proteobacteria bacterium]|nr:tetratricopeptide repeat protein [Pseudomonadota bacterium]